MVARHSEVLRNGFFSLALKVSGAGAAYLMLFALARALSPAEYGKFGFSFSLAIFLGVLGSFGLRNVVLRWLPIYLHEKKTEEAFGLIKLGYMVVLAGCAVAGAIAYLGAQFAPSTAGQHYMLGCIALAVGLGISEYQSHVQRGVGRLVIALFPREVAWRVSVVGLAATAFFVGYAPTAAEVLAAAVGMLCLIVVAQAFLCEQTTPNRLWSAQTKYEIDRWRASVPGLWGSSIIAGAVPELSVVILGLLLTPQMVGPFFSALKTAILIDLVLTASNMVTAPVMSRYLYTGQREAVKRLCKIVGVGIALYTSIIAAVFVVWGESLLGLFGQHYAVAYPELLVMATGQVVNSWCGPVVSLMNMNGNERVVFRVMTVAGVSAMALLPILIGLFGSMGAAVAVALGTCAHSVVLTFWIRRRLGIDAGVLMLAVAAVRQAISAK